MPLFESDSQPVLINAFSVNLCNVNQVSKAFLSSIDATGPSKQRIIYDYFIRGDVKMWRKYVGGEDVGEDVFEDRLDIIGPQMALFSEKYGDKAFYDFNRIASQVWRLVLLDKEFRASYTRA